MCRDRPGITPGEGRSLPLSRLPASSAPIDSGKFEFTDNNACRTSLRNAPCRRARSHHTRSPSVSVSPLFSPERLSIIAWNKQISGALSALLFHRNLYDAGYIMERHEEKYEVRFAQRGRCVPLSRPNSQKYPLRSQSVYVATP